MTRQQKIILAVLAVLDLAVIGTIGTVAFTAARRGRLSQATPLPAVDVEADPCITTILDALSEPAAPAFVSWTPDAARIDVSCPASAAEATSAETIWELIDRLPPNLKKHCPTPVTVTIAVHTGVPRDRTQTAVFAGTTLMAWLHGDLSDDDLAAEARYRTISAATP